MNQRLRTDYKYNLDIFDETNTDGIYQMPIIKCDNYIPKSMISFNYANSSKNTNCCVHFYLDDYQFERLWNDPYKYIDRLSQYECILSPDFSLYKDMSMAMKMYNTFRSRLIGQFYQACGIKVIPTISWCEKDTYEFCFDGIPKGSIVSVSTIGVIRNKEAKQIWKDGITEMIKRIEPKTILIYGKPIDYDFGDIEVMYFENSNVKRLRELKRE